MAATDPISDFITVLRNATKAKKEKITVPSSKMLAGICSILKEENYIEDYKTIDEGNKKFLRVHLKHQVNEPAIRFLGRVSKPGLRKYVSSKDVKKVLGGFGISIISTPKGLLTNKKARENNVGGELLIKVW
ncbi:MAG: 30S ribosomal protein S8 [Candidatus Omnitrophica bacterium]|nr:30S ribosomal protein S8 [Candidatus Omnitrophota bacterium]